MHPLPSYPLTGPDAATLPSGETRPIGASGLPLMERREANFHAHVSGMVARETAEAEGDPAALSALASGAAGEVVIGGITLIPFTLGTSILLEKLGSAYVQPNPTGQPIAIRPLDVARAVLAFSRPEWLYQRLEAGDLAGIDAEATQLAFRLRRDVMAEINEWMNREMAEFNAPEATEKKPGSPDAPAPAAPMPSPESPAPAPATSPDGGPH